MADTESTTTRTGDHLRGRQPNTGEDGGLGHTKHNGSLAKRKFGGTKNQGWVQQPEGPNYIDCTDGKTRRVEPGIFPLAHGVPNRVGTLRGAGNAIVPQVAAVFVRAFMETAAGEGGCWKAPAFSNAERAAASSAESSSQCT